MAKNKQAKLVSFEGPDGVGKSTHVKLLALELAHAGNKVAISKLPAYNTATGGLIKRMLQDGRAVRWPNLFQLVQFVDKLVFQWFVLPKMLREFDYVLLDRWHASMWAYGLAGGANEWLTNTCVNLMRQPDAVLVFHGTCKRENAQDAYEKDKAFQKSVALHYVLWTITNNKNAHAILADRPSSEVRVDVANAVYSIEGKP
jgi:thymidylate kinase